MTRDLTIKHNFTNLFAYLCEGYDATVVVFQI